MRHAALILAALLATPCPWAVAQAQSGGSGASGGAGALRPIDPIVEDVDPLQRSLRRLEPGIGAPGVDSDSHVFQDNTSGGDPSKFYYIRPGVIAQYNRSDYFTVVQRKQFVTYQAVGPNTVYLIGGIPRSSASAHDGPTSPLLVQARIAGRVEDSASTGASEADPGPTLAQQWQSYLRFREAQRRTVLSALDRAVTSKPQPAPPAPTSNTTALPRLKF